MRIYRQQMEAAYLTSRRQGDMARDSERESSAHQDRRNRYLYRGEHGPHSHRQFTMPGSAAPWWPENDPALASDQRGKGPRNYRRSDSRIHEIVCDVLGEDPYLDASDIEVTVRDGEIILSGWVDDRYAKRRAEDLAENVAGVQHIENRIRINSPGRTGATREATVELL